jgi:dihydrofolate synthase/folylpolyglutamate synthase
VAAFDRLLDPDRASWKLDLSRIRALVTALDHPERACPIVLIAGTNGKGSVAAMVERALRAAGLRTGRYTSPHLVRPEERIAIDGVPVDGAAFTRAIEDVLAVEAACLDDGRLADRATFFEAMTAVAFELLRRARVDVAVVEVGLGGRLDATNVCHPVATAIVSIDFDHQAWLGDTRAAIAAEKAGIARPDVPLVVGDLTDEALDAVVAAAGAAGAPLVYAAEGIECVVLGAADGRLTITLDTATRTYGPVRLGLAGDHQVANAFVAVALLEALDDAGIHVDRGAVETGLADARWPGRLDRVALPDGRRALLDAAHNAAGARALAAWLARTAPGTPPPLVFAAAADKDVAGMIRALAPAVGDIVVTAFADPRAMAAEALAQEVRAVLAGAGSRAGRVHVAPTTAAALEAAWRLARDIVVAGSIFLLGEAYPLLGRPDPFEPERPAGGS